MKILSMVMALLALYSVYVQRHTGQWGDSENRTHLGPVEQDSALLLPIEVMGADGTTASVSVKVSDASQVKRLFVKAHSIGYPDYVGYSDAKASIRLNGGMWKDIDNRLATCVYPESQYDCIAGPYATVRFHIDIQSLGKVRDGANEIEFRFNYIEGDISSGYRILSLDLLNDDGSSAIDGTELAYDDPTLWTPITDDVQRLQNGERLFQTRRTLTDFPGGPPIIASCADCHTQGGRDLKYFNYSNHSIVTRSTFHGLSEKEGEDIASWIRSYELRDRDGVPYAAPGTPWDPPYQPGPGLDSQPVHRWAAGAGLEWVLDHDATIYAHFVPVGHTLADVLDIDATLNRRELPLALQLPDWNEWLPVIHPLDAWGETFESSRLWQSYEHVYALEATDAEAIEAMVESRKIDRVVASFFKDVKDFSRHEGVANLPQEMTRRQKATAQLGLYQWDLVKTWELMHVHHLEDITGDLYPEGEPRGWFSIARTVFNLAPHIHGMSKGYRGDVTNTYYDTAWYELQVILNSGNRETAGLKPVDWKYHFAHIRDWKKATGVSHGMRYVSAYLKVLQNANNRHGVQMPDGFYLRHTTLAWIHELAMPEGGKNVLYELDEIQPHLKRDLAEAFTREMLKKLRRHDYSEWDRTEGQSGIEPATYMPTPPRNRRNKRGLFDRTSYADHFYRIIPLFAELGVDPDLLNELAQWGRGAWPQGDWDTLIQTN